MILQNVWETEKGSWYHKIFEEREETRKTFTGLEHEKKQHIIVPQRNEMLSWYFTALGFISNNEEYNLEGKIPKGRYLKKLISQKVFKQ